MTKLPTSNSSFKMLPWFLILLRAVLPIGLFWFSGSPFRAAVCPVLVLLAALSDVFDGVIARRLGSVSPSLRRSDSIADVIFLFGAIGAFVLRFGSPSMPELLCLGLMLGLCISGHIIALIRFRKTSAVHSKFMKVYAVVVYVALFAAWMDGDLSPWVYAPLVFSLFAEIERHVILLKSSVEPIDVPSMSMVRSLGDKQGDQGKVNPSQETSAL